MLGNIGPAEAIIIIAVLVSIFGKKKTSEIARDVGEASKEFKRFGKEYHEAVEDLKKPLEGEAPAKESPPQAEAAQLGNQTSGREDEKTSEPASADASAGKQTAVRTAKQLDEQTIKATQSKGKFDFPKVEPAQTAKKGSKTKGGEKSA